MPHRFRVVGKLCINCGICMDVCPARALDMTRSRRPGPESEFVRAGAAGKPWMMEFPSQVDKCVGCMLCVWECPTGAAVVEAVAVEPPYRSRGVLYPEPADGMGWTPLEAYTRAAERHDTGRDPWPARELKWRTALRQKRLARRFAMAP